MQFCRTLLIVFLSFFAIMLKKNCFFNFFVYFYIVDLNKQKKNSKIYTIIMVLAV